MSYKRRFTKQISVPYQETVYYPASQSGGSKTVSGYVHDTIEVEVYIDTDPFDAEVADCGDHVDTLTSSVVTTESAQVVSIRENSIRIGNTIIEGFFNNVRFEISSKIMELSKRIDALLIDIKEKGDQLMKLKSQMEVDYHRTASRYSKLFNELDTELENRVFSLDQPIFDMARTIDNVESRLLESDLVDIVALAGAENTMLESQLCAIQIKNHAKSVLSDTSMYIASKQRTDNTIKRSALNEAKSQFFYTPVCYLQANDNHNISNANIYVNSLVSPNIGEKIKQQVLNIDTSSRTNEAVTRYFESEVERYNVDAGEHTERVKKLITQMYKTNNQ